MSQSDKASQERNPVLRMSLQAENLSELNIRTRIRQKANLKPL
jgi:hypothetical protein